MILKTFDRIYEKAVGICLAIENSYVGLIIGCTVALGSFVS